MHQYILNSMGEVIFHIPAICSSKRKPQTTLGSLDDWHPLKVSSQSFTFCHQNVSRGSHCTGPVSDEVRPAGTLMLTSCHLIIKVSYFQAIEVLMLGISHSFHLIVGINKKEEKNFLPIQSCISTHFAEVMGKS